MSPLVEVFQVFNPYPANYPLTLWRALLNDYGKSLLRVQTELTARVIGSRWPYHSKDAQDRPEGYSASRRGTHTSFDSNVNGRKLNNHEG